MINVLTITNDAEVLNLLSEFLLMHMGPTNVDSYATGRTALDPLHSGRYDLVFLDTQTIDIGAIAFLSRIAALQPKALTVVIMEQQDQRLVAEALRCGAYDFLTKPIVRDYLAASLGRVSQNMRLLECTRAKDDLLAGLAHDLRTPLNIILNWVQLLRLEKPDESIRDLAVEMIERSVKEQAELLARFETLSLSLANTPPSSLAAAADSTQVRALGQSTPEIKTVPRVDLPPLEGLEILVVDDEPDSRTLLRIMLSQAGAEVTAVESVKEALVQFQRAVPDILISDIGMPGEDGYSLIRSVRKLEAEAGGTIPALALTAYATSDEHNRTLQAGFDAYLSKPVEPSYLEQVVAKLKSQIPSTNRRPIS